MNIAVFDQPIPTGWHSNDFIEITNPEHPLFVHVNWKNPDLHRSKGVDIVYAQCEIAVFPKTISLCLYEFPKSLVMNFPIQDLLLPGSLSGVVIIARLSWSYLKDRKPKEVFEEMKGDPSLNAITWARNNDLPIVVVLVKERDEEALFSLDDFRASFDLDINIPIITCLSGLNKENVDLTLSTVVKYILA